jgi:hypothetical protein
MFWRTVMSTVPAQNQTLYSPAMSWLPHECQYRKLCHPSNCNDNIFYLAGLLTTTTTTTAAATATTATAIGLSPGGSIPTLVQTKIKQNCYNNNYKTIKIST